MDDTESSIADAHKVQSESNDKPKNLKNYNVVTDSDDDYEPEQANFNIVKPSQNNQVSAEFDKSKNHNKPRATFGVVSVCL